MELHWFSRRETKPVRYLTTFFSKFHEERATDPRDKEQYGKVAGTRGTLKQLNNLIYAGSGLLTI